MTLLIRVLRIHPELCRYEIESPDERLPQPAEKTGYPLTHS